MLLSDSWITDLKSLSLKADFTAIRTTDTCHHLDQRGFACAVFADEGTDFSGSKIEVDSH